MQITEEMFDLAWESLETKTQMEWIPTEPNGWSQREAFKHQLWNIVQQIPDHGITILTEMPFLETLLRKHSIIYLTHYCKFYDPDFPISMIDTPENQESIEYTAKSMASFLAAVFVELDNPLSDLVDQSNDLDSEMEELLRQNGSSDSE